MTTKFVCLSNQVIFKKKKKAHLRLKSNYAFFQSHPSFWSSLVITCSQPPDPCCISELRMSSVEALRLVGSSLQAKTWEPQSLPTKTHIFTHPVVLKIPWVSKPLAIESLPALHSLQKIPQHLLAVDKAGAYGCKTPSCCCLSDLPDYPRLPRLLSNVT